MDGPGSNLARICGHSSLPCERCNDRHGGPSGLSGKTGVRCCKRGCTFFLRYPSSRTPFDRSRSLQRTPVMTLTNSVFFPCIKIFFLISRRSIAPHMVWGWNQSKNMQQVFSPDGSPGSFLSDEVLGFAPRDTFPKNCMFYSVARKGGSDQKSFCSRMMQINFAPSHLSWPHYQELQGP